MRAGVESMLLLAPWVLLGLWILYVIGPASVLRTDDRGVVAQNLLRRTSFEWGRVVDIDMSWQIRFSLDDGSTVTAFGGPARARPRRRPASVLPDGQRSGDTVRVPVGYTELTELRDRWHSADATGHTPVSRSWDLPALCALLVIVLGAVVAVLVAHS